MKSRGVTSASRSTLREASIDFNLHRRHLRRSAGKRNDAQALTRAKRSSLVDALHSFFHDLAARRVDTRFGRLTDNPRAILAARAANLEEGRSLSMDGWRRQMRAAIRHWARLDAAPSEERERPVTWGDEVITDIEAAWRHMERTFRERPEEITEEDEPSA